MNKDQNFGAFSPRYGDDKNTTMVMNLIQLKESISFNQNSNDISSSLQIIFSLNSDWYALYRLDPMVSDIEIDFKTNSITFSQY
jgi:hypothetical protein